MKKERSLKLVEWDNFKDKWDFARFVTLVGALGAQDTFPDRQEICKLLSDCRAHRNSLAHLSYSEDNDGLDDDHLYRFISETKRYLPRLNGMDKDSEAIAKLKRRVDELLSCLPSLWAVAEAAGEVDQIQITLTVG